MPANRPGDLAGCRAVLWERHPMAAVAAGEGRLPRLTHDAIEIVDGSNY
jgi:hypothetical protein